MEYNLTKLTIWAKFTSIYVANNIFFQTQKLFSFISFINGQIKIQNTKLEKLKIKIKMASNSIQMKKENPIKIIILKDYWKN